MGRRLTKAESKALLYLFLFFAVLGWVINAIEKIIVIIQPYYFNIFLLAIFLLSIYLIVKIVNTYKKSKESKTKNTTYLQSTLEPQKVGTPEYTTPDSKISHPKRSRRILPRVKREVWRRDKGRCVECGSRRNLEYDHIIPFSKGGGNTARNIELLCEKCNRSKSAKI